MGFKLDIELKNITSPILLITGNGERYFENGSTLANLEFERKCEVISIDAIESKVVIAIADKSPLPTEDWTDRDLSFF